MALYFKHICTTRQCEFLGIYDCLHAVIFFEHRYFESENALVTIYIPWSLKRKTKIRYGLDRAREIDGLPGASLAEIFSMASVLYSSSRRKLSEFK